MKRILLLPVALLSLSIFAKEPAFPPQCKDIGVNYANGDAMLIAKKITSRVYGISNISKDPIWMNHENPNGGGMGAGFASQINPGNWSALLVGQNDFSVDCHVQTKTGMTVVPCQKVLRVCEFQKLHTMKQGQYWVVENVPASQLMEHLKIRGF